MNKAIQLCHSKVENNSLTILNLLFIVNIFITDMLNGKCFLKSKNAGPYYYILL